MSNVWKNPIFDRTLDDVTFAIRKIAEWKKNHTHRGDIKVEGDKLVLQDGGMVYIEDESLILINEDGVAYVEDDKLIAQLGVVYDLKGCLNLSDISRIEGNIAYLAEQLTKNRYPIVVNSKEWSGDSLPTAQDMSRIASNIRSMIDEFAKSSKSTVVPEVMLSYTDINALEYNLYLLKELLDVMVGGFIKLGNYNCGSTDYDSGATTLLPKYQKTCNAPPPRS